MVESMDGWFYKVDVAEKRERRRTWRKVFGFGLEPEFEAKEKNDEKAKKRVKDCRFFHLKGNES